MGATLDSSNPLHGRAIPRASAHKVGETERFVETDSDPIDKSAIGSARKSRYEGPCSQTR
jgi:hypothetical protein